MIVDLIFGIIILMIIIYIGLRIIKNVVLGTIFVTIVFLASFLIIGRFPNLRKIPILGYFFSSFKFPSTTGEMIGIVKRFFYNPEITGVSRDSQGNLLVTLSNKGVFSVSNCKIFVDGVEPEILNNPKKTLSKDDSTIYELNWKENFSRISVKCKEASSTFP